MASRLVEAEASASTQNEELDILRTMVHTLQTENSHLKRQMKESNEQWRIRDEELSGSGGNGVKAEQVNGDPRNLKRSRGTV